MQERYERLSQLIQQGDFSAVQQLTEELVQQDQAVQEVIERAVMPALDKVGRMFSAGQCFIPEMLVAAKASQKALDILKPRLAHKDYQPRGRVVIGTVKGDLHDIGKNIVAMVFQSNGFAVRDLGVDVAPQAFVEAIKGFNPQVLALSCLITTTMTNMKVTIEAVVESGLREQVQVIIGGPPTSRQLAQEIGADFHGQNAYQGVELIKQAIKG